MNEKPMIMYRRSGGEPQVRHRLEIYGDGLTIYRSKAGEVGFSIPMPRLEEISRMLVKEKFLSMPKFYSPPILPDDVMDYKLTFRYQGKENSVTVTTSGTAPESWARELVTASRDPPSFWHITNEMEELISSLATKKLKI